MSTTAATEIIEHRDRASGVRVRQLTEHLGHSHHPYFTNPPWFDNGRKLLIASDRDNAANLFGVDLEDGTIAQITDFTGPNDFLTTAINPQADEAYCKHGGGVWAVDPHRGHRRELWRIPEGFVPSMLNVTADGAAVCIGLYEDLSDRFDVALHSGYVGMRDIFEANPLSRIVRIPLDGQPAETVHEDRTWIGHVNTSPTQAEVLTFCHEGPWERVDHRIWGLDLRTRRTWRIRPRDEPGERIGHEYWHADGERVGYHGEYTDGRRFLGHVRYDDTDRVEAAFPGRTGHIHSNGPELIVGDGGGVIRLWRWDGQRYDGPRVLCRHRSNLHHQKAHPHPRFTPQADRVVFTSDLGGYCNVYLADVPAFDALPPVEDEA